MALNRARLNKCRAKLKSLARRGNRMSYSEMRKHLGLKHHLNLGPYLDAIYEEDRARDLTLILHYKDREFGAYNSCGRPARTVPFDPNDPARIQAYRSDLRRLFRYWQDH